jgi:hypothetical protein
LNCNPENLSSHQINIYLLVHQGKGEVLDLQTCDPNFQVHDELLQDFHLQDEGGDPYEVFL